MLELSQFLKGGFMAYICQLRKKIKSYSPKARRAWYVCYNDPADGFKAEKVGCKKLANHRCMEIEAELKCAKYGIKLNDDLITDILKIYSEKCKDKAIKSIILTIGPSFDGVRYSSLTRQMYEEKRLEWNRIDNPAVALSITSKRSYEKRFRAAINQYDKNSIFRQGRIKYLKIKSLMNSQAIPLTPNGMRDVSISGNEFNKILEEQKNENVKDLIISLRYSGISNGKLRTAKWDDINFMSNKIIVHDINTYIIEMDLRVLRIFAKRKMRRWKYTQEIIDICKPNLSAKAKKNLLETAVQYVFPEEILFGKACFYHSCLNSFKDACEKLGFRKYILHDLRHTAATAWYKKCKNIYKVCSALGHSTISLTEEYIDSDKIYVGHVFDNISIAWKELKLAS
jgi:integrase